MRAVRTSPANKQLRRAQLVLLLAILIPTLLMSAVGIVLLVRGETATTITAGVLVLCFCTSGITGYILGSIYVRKGASLVRLQSDFVHSVSHELRTPLTSIRLFIESLRDNRLEDTDRVQVLSLLARETERLEVLVDRVLELSRLQSSYVYAREPIEVRALAEEAIAAFDAASLSNPTPIEVQIERGLTVRGDRPTLVGALSNLLINAWKYTGETKVISIEAWASGRWLEIRVVDNGSGIAVNEQPAIFAQFTRGVAATQSGIPGVGLGLSFVRAIIHGHGGKIDFTSEPGRTAFRIRLPYRRDREVTATRAQVTEATS